MPSRNKTELKNNEVFYVRKKDSKKVFRVFSVEQLTQMILAEKITLEDHVGIQRTAEGLGSPRGSENENVVKRVPLSSDNPWSYAPRTVALEAEAFIREMKGE